MTGRRRNLAPGWLAATFLLAFCGYISSPARADAPAAGPAVDRITGWNLQISLYTVHWDPEPEHNNDQNMVTVEARLQRDWLAGLSVFDNSYDQSSQLLYVGKTWPVLDSPHWYFKLIGGLIHGYDYPYDDKIPFNGLGIAPAIIPSLGFRHRHLMVEAHFAGLAAMTITAGVRF